MLTKNRDYLGDKEFRQLTFDMMLAWDAPSSEIENLDKVCEYFQFNCLLVTQQYNEVAIPQDVIRFSFAINLNYFFWCSLALQ